MKHVIYLRCSTTEQADSGLGLEAQEARCRAYCVANDLPEPLLVSDPGCSGSNLDRPGWQRIAALIETGECGSVVVAKLDRLTRRMRDLLDLTDLFREQGVALHSVAEHLDTDSAMGRFFMGLIGLISQWEREVIAERTAEALGAKKRRGEYTGGRAPIGTKIVGERVLNEKGKPLPRPVETDPQAAKLARYLRARNLSLRGISVRLAALGTVSETGRLLGPESVKRLLKQTETAAGGA